MAGITNIGVSGSSQTGLGMGVAQQRSTAQAGNPFSSAKGVKPQEKKTSGGTQQLSSEQQQAVEKLKQRDAEVRQHEQAHLAVAGTYARGGAHYTYTRGPDGQMYATGGEVSIDTGAERDPEATIRKEEQVRAAALAPANPSGQDRAVAAQAAQIEGEARAELAQQQTAKASGNTDTAQAASTSTAQGASRQQQQAYQGFTASSSGGFNVSA